MDFDKIFFSFLARGTKRFVPLELFKEANIPQRPLAFLVLMIAAVIFCYLSSEQQRMKGLKKYTKI